MGRTEAQLEGYLVITTIQLSLCLNSDIFLIAKRFLPACGLTFIHICSSSCGYAHLQSLFSYRLHSCRGKCVNFPYIVTKVC